MRSECERPGDAIHVYERRRSGCRSAEGIPHNIAQCVLPSGIKAESHSWRGDGLAADVVPILGDKWILWANKVEGVRQIVAKQLAAVIFDFGEWRSEVSSHRNPDGSLSFRAIDPGVDGFDLEFVVGEGAKRTLILHEAQREYTFTEK